LAGQALAVPRLQYCVTPHCAQGPPLGPLKPGRHTHELCVPEPSALDESAGQPTHLPASSSTSAALYVSAAQFWHPEESARPSAVEYRPAPQPVHAAAWSCPVLGWNVPAPHRSHAVDPEPVW
jgi:hypothetical protein